MNQESLSFEESKIQTIKILTDFTPQLTAKPLTDFYYP
jgi:hypothetical protein